jgi:hypothetical protein
LVVTKQGQSFIGDRHSGTDRLSPLYVKALRIQSSFYKKKQFQDIIFNFNSDDLMRCNRSDPDEIEAQLIEPKLSANRNLLNERQAEKDKACGNLSRVNPLASSHWENENSPARRQACK